MRTVVIFLWKQEEEWDVLYIRKGESLVRGGEPSCVGPGRRVCPRELSEAP
jgi:hypothetical protein